MSIGAWCVSDGVYNRSIELISAPQTADAI